MEVEKQLAGIASDSSTSSSEEMKLNTIYEKVRYLVSGNAVVVFTISGCCMCHVVKQLLFSLGVGPTVVELDREAAGLQIHGFLSQIAGEGQQQPVPAVFVGGKFLGGVETLMACHINGTLVPHLKDAGALWL
ncbi:Glutaredoxin, grx [Heracleum sosnowskyi]|uniref:Glutaredoxin, grx n=1 Tax=Heracleum sosnowskyi TaxID=360622 RepID=A0AAD8HZA6_9APIA|nr:Glutaredoxin, grx [Heracleum sosnowskyi]